MKGNFANSKQLCDRNGCFSTDKDVFKYVSIFYFLTLGSVTSSVASSVAAASVWTAASTFAEQAPQIWFLQLRFV